MDNHRFIQSVKKTARERLRKREKDGRRSEKIGMDEEIRFSLLFLSGTRC